MLFKAILRILHFILTLYIYLTTSIKQRLHRYKQSFRYKVLWLLNGLPDDDLTILETFKDHRITKIAKHSALLLNRRHPSPKTLNP
jgi:hypothetical protein